MNKYKEIILLLKDDNKRLHLYNNFIKIDKELIYKNIYKFFQNDTLSVFNSYHIRGLIVDLVAIMVYLYSEKIIKL